MDISSIKDETLGKAKLWLLLIDDATDYCFSFFMNQKSDLSKTVGDLVNTLKVQQDIKVGVIHCDNASENKKLETDSKKDGLGLIFEYTAPNTPQQNGRVIRKSEINVELGSINKGLKRKDVGRDCQYSNRS